MCALGLPHMAWVLEPKSSAVVLCLHECQNKVDVVRDSELSEPVFSKQTKNAYLCDTQSLVIIKRTGAKIWADRAYSLSKFQPLVFLTGSYTEVVSTTITLFNPTDDKVAFKVKTTAPKYYLVRPNCRILNKGESITVSGSF